MNVNPVKEVEKIYGFSAMAQVIQVDECISNTEHEAIRYWMERYITLLEKYNSLLFNRKLASKTFKVKSSGSHRPLLRRTELL